MYALRLFPLCALIGGLMAVLLPGFSGIGLCETLTLEDSRGEQVQVRLPVQRIVVLNSDALEALRILKATELVVGVHSDLDRTSGFWGELAALPGVGRWNEPELEAIVALNPDLVIAYGRNPGPLLEQKLPPLGIQVLRLDFYKITTLEREVLDLGRLLDRNDAAGAFCAWHGRALTEIRARASRASSLPPVYLEGYTDYHASGPGSGGDMMCTLAYGRNIAAGLGIPYPRVTPEWVLAREPQVIFKAVSRENGYLLTDRTAFDRRRDAIRRRPAWGHIPAVASNNVHALDSAIFAGPRSIVGVAFMACAIHPELFADYDPEALHREYLERFQGVAYRGVYTSTDIREAPR